MSDGMTGALLAGQVAFVTGAARGLGRTIVDRMAAAGATGSMFDILPDDGSDPLPEDWMFHVGDVSSETDIGKAMDETVDRHGRIDVVVACAGLVPSWRRIEALDMEVWRNVFAVNVEGVAITLKLAAQQMIGRGGSIIAMGSLNSWQGHPEQATYVASKHAVLGLVRSAALDLGKHDIRVNAVGPGPIATDALLGRISDRAAKGGLSMDEALQAMAGDTALGRMASDTDIAGACLFLASELANGVTGQLIRVDAGIA